MHSSSQCDNCEPRCNGANNDTRSTNDTYRKTQNLNPASERVLHAAEAMLCAQKKSMKESLSQSETAPFANQIMHKIFDEATAKSLDNAGGATIIAQT